MSLAHTLSYDKNQTNSSQSQSYIHYPKTCVCVIAAVYNVTVFVVLSAIVPVIAYSEN